MKRIIYFLLIAIIAVSFTGCCHKRVKKQPESLQYDRPLGPGENALVKITDPALIPDFSNASTANLMEPVLRSINYMNKPSSKTHFPVSDISHEKVLTSLEAFAELLDKNLSGPELNAAIREKFDVYTSIGCDRKGTVLFTGYYTPIFDGSLQQTGEFQYPLYNIPDNLVKGPDGEIKGRSGSDGTITPYPPRAVIEEAKMFRGSELVWLNDPFKAYIAHVQGSAKIRLPDGKLMGVGYAANNGHEYNSVGKAMIEQGALGSSGLSLADMIDYFEKHPDEVSRYVNQNPRYVFFQNQEGDPRGSLNEPVTTMRTIATDKSIFPRASLTFIATSLPMKVGGSVSQQVYSGFALDQDTGGAIRAPGRCDVYMGLGDEAGELAGQTYKEGRLYYIFLKD